VSIFSIESSFNISVYFFCSSAKFRSSTLSETDVGSIFVVDWFAVAGAKVLAFLTAGLLASTF
jgi:hypothetical protein